VINAYVAPAMAPPMIGATLNSQTCASAALPANPRDAEGPGRVHGQVGHRDPDQVDRGQAEADGDQGEALGRTIVGRAQPAPDGQVRSIRR
jgi:hypothetical protein